MTTATRTHARELTEWYSADVKPVHVGVYETAFDIHVGFCHWNGRQWGNQYLTLERADMLKVWPGNQDKAWRGLKEPA
jgi:hypothetical protein